MVNYERFILDNGLVVIIYPDNSTPLVHMNVLYDVGSKDESSNMSGMAHLVEHLTFKSIQNKIEFQKILHKAGGIYKAYTTNDITNYQLTLPRENIEIAFWLESNRMRLKTFSSKNISIQKNIIYRELKKSINNSLDHPLNELRKLAYTIHPYKSPPIGHVDQLQNIESHDITSFVFKHYCPKNAIVSIGGNVEINCIKRLSEKWFGDIIGSEKPSRKLPVEPRQEAARKKILSIQGSSARIYKAWQTNSRFTQDYYATDLITEIIGSGISSLLYAALVKKKKLFSDIQSYQTGSLDVGLLVVQGRVSEMINIDLADHALNMELEKITSNTITMFDIMRAKNRIEHISCFENVKIQNLCEKLCFYDLIDINLINSEKTMYEKLTHDFIAEIANKTLRTNACNTLFIAKTL